MRTRTIALAFVLAPGLAVAAPEGAPTIAIASIRAPVPPHCLAAEQWKDPNARGPLNLFDGDPERAWVMCPEAAREPDYTLEIRFEKPVTADELRLVLGAAGLEEVRARPKRIDVGLRNGKLSTLFPINVRTLELPAGRRVHLLSLWGPLRWNPALIDDLGFHDRRRALGYDEHEIPMPLTIDGLTLVFRDLAPGAAPPAIGELTLLRDEKPVPVTGLDAARAAHVAFIERGLRHIVGGRYLVGAERTLHFAPDGAVWEIPAAAWKQGRTRPAPETAPAAADAKPPAKAPAASEVAAPTRKPAVAAEPDRPPRKIGAWRIAAGRLEYAREARFAPLEYLVDDAPHRVRLCEPLAGTYTVRTAPPAAADTAPLPTLGADPLGELPPGDEKAEAPRPVIPIP